MLIGGFLLATLVMCVPVGIFGSSNLVWGDANQYGTMKFPGTKVVHLPSGEVDVALALFIVGKGNETVEVPIPKDISLSLSPVTGAARPQISKDLGISGNSLSGTANSQRRVWTVQVPKDGDYTAKASGNLFGARQMQAGIRFRF